MYLRKIYSEPLGLFKPKEIVEFKDGINYIYGKKDDESDSKDSLNGIGKSLILDCIDFCLLSSFTPRLKLALGNGLLEDYKAVLEFEVDDNFYIIKRSFENPNEDIEFGEIDNTNLFKNTKTESKLKEILCDLIFKDDSYDGIYSNQWLRKLLPFFIKIQPPKKEKFTDPVQYMNGPNATELNQYLFKLMGLNNALLFKNFEINSLSKQKSPVIQEVEKYIKESFGYKEISDAEDAVDKINSDIKKLEDVIATFKLESAYENVEQDANKLTEKIKSLWFENHLDKERIYSYLESYKTETTVNVSHIKKLYEEVNSLLASKLEATLEEAIAFREGLTSSRKKFLQNEIKTLQSKIEARTLQIRKYEDERVQFFNFLSNRKAIKDLSDAYLLLSQKRDTLNNLGGKLKLFRDYQKEDADLKSESAKLYSDILVFLADSKEKISEFKTVFTEIYNNVYIQNKDESKFAILPKEKTDSKVVINISFPAGLSKGKNQGRTLIYDLAVLINSINNDLHSPRFLIHDGIFDGMYKGHFIHLIKYLNTLKSTARFQYIITLNEEGTLDQRFGVSDGVNTSNIENEAILVLTPNTKLLNKSY